MRIALKIIFKAIWTELYLWFPKDADCRGLFCSSQQLPRVKPPHPAAARCVLQLFVVQAAAFASSLCPLRSWGFMFCVAIHGDATELFLEEFLSLVSKSRTYTSSSVKSLCISFLSHILFFFPLSKCGFSVKGYQGKTAARSQINSSGHLKQLRLEISRMRLVWNPSVSLLQASGAAAKGSTTSSQWAPGWNSR